jgi:hypothetical protein
MKTPKPEFRERVVKEREVRRGKVIRTFWCIHDPDYLHWMSVEPFDGLIWTKDTSYRREFASRKEAKAELARFLEWRGARDRKAEAVDTGISPERKAA